MSIDARAIAERVADVVNRRVLGRVEALEAQLAQVSKELELWKDTGIKSAIAAVMELKTREIAREVAAKIYADLASRERPSDELKEIGFLILEKLDALSKAKPAVPQGLKEAISSLSKRISELNDSIVRLENLVSQKLSGIEGRISRSDLTGLKGSLQAISKNLNELTKRIKSTSQLLEQLNERIDTMEQLIEYVHDVSSRLDKQLEEWEKEEASEEGES